MKLNKIKFFKPNISISENLAIVGSSASILKKENGKNIDTHDDVIRFNKATTKNFEKFVGEKTTLRVINNHVFQSHKKDSFEEISFTNIAVVSPFTFSDDDKNNYQINKNKYFFFESRFKQFIICFYFVTHINIFLKLINLIKNKNFSAGFLTILVCVASKIKPNIFGFDLSEDMSKRSHYHVKNFPIGGVHNLAQEHLILKLLEMKGLIKIFDIE